MIVTDDSGRHWTRIDSGFRPATDAELFNHGVDPVGWTDGWFWGLMSGLGIALVGVIILAKLSVTAGCLG